MNLDSVLANVENAISRENGDGMAVCMNLQGLSAQIKAKILLECANVNILNRMCNNNVDRVYANLVSLHLQSLYASSQDNHLTAVNCALKATGAFFEAIENQKDTNWFLPAVRVVTLQLRLCSIAADELLQRKGEKTKYILEAKELLERYMRLFNMDRSAKSKKMGNLFLFNHLIKVFFKINNLRMCSHVINQVNNNPAFPNLDTFSKAQACTFRYYLGRLMLFEEKYSEAEKQLDQALTKCNRDHPKNVRRILQFLVPLKLWFGVPPAKGMLRKYNLEVYEDIAIAVRTGDLKRFNASLEANQDFFIKKGMTLLMEKLRSHVFVSLFKHVHKSSADPKFLNLGITLRVVKQSMEDMDMDELECIIANMIAKRRIKGYIVHGKSVVLAKMPNDPFPPISANV